MFEPGSPRMKHVIGPDGGLLTIADLPAPETKRWVIRRKAVVVAAVRGGLLTLAEACTRYALTVDELPLGNIRSIATVSLGYALPSSRNTQAGSALVFANACSNSTRQRRR
jgi:hypothetical protein